MGVNESWRGVALATGRGLLEILTGSDPAVFSHSPRKRRIINVLAALGALLIGLAIVILILALYHVQAPGFGILRINTVTRGKLRSFSGTTVTQVSVTSIKSLKSIEILVGLGAFLLALRSSLPLWRFVFLTSLLGPLLTRIGWGPMLPLRTGSEFMQLVLLVVIFCVAGFRHSRGALWWMWAVMMIPLWLWYRPGWEEPVVASVVLTALAVALDALGATQRTRRALVAQSARTELEEARRAVLGERPPLARGGRHLGAAPTEV